MASLGTGPSSALRNGAVSSASVIRSASSSVAPSTSLSPHREYQGIVFNKFPFRLDVSTEYQDWILVVMSALLLSLWCLPCFCGHLRNSCARSFTRWIYTRLNIYFWTITYVNLFIVMCTLSVLPDWTVDEYIKYLVLFTSWLLIHMKKMITSAGIIVAFVLVWKFQEKIRVAAGLEHITLVHFSLREMLGMSSKKRPVELFVWKVEDLQSSTGKIYKPNDVFVECHLGDNEPMRTRVHNNAGTSCVIKESFQMNINENDTSTLMTLLVKDQALMVSTELARLMLSTREVCGIEDQTGKRKVGFTYSEESFLSLNMIPRGKIWIAISPVDDIDEEKAPLMTQDDAILC